MKKILYVLCLLTTLVACSDDDDKIITDYDKPYTKLPSSELRTLIEDNINSCVTLAKEFNEMGKNNSIFDIMNYYRINFDFNILDFMNSRSSDPSKENTFTGMKLVWNKDKQDFDTTINAAGFMEIFFPSSKTDQSKNDLHFIATINYSTNVYLETKVYNEEKVLFRQVQQYNKETSEAIQVEEYPPYSATIKMNINDDHIAIVDNGEMITFKDGKLQSYRDSITIEDVMIDGLGIGDVGVKVIDDRNQLQNDGVVIIGMTIDGKTREIVANTDVQTRGFIYLKDSENVVKGIMNIAETELESYKNKTEEDIRDVRQNIKDKVNKYIIKETGKRPVILPVIIEL